MDRQKIAKEQNRSLLLIVLWYKYLFMVCHSTTLKEDILLLVSATDATCCELDQRKYYRRLHMNTLALD